MHAGFSTTQEDTPPEEQNQATAIRGTVTRTHSRLYILCNFNSTISINCRKRCLRLITLHLYRKKHTSRKHFANGCLVQGEVSIIFLSNTHLHVHVHILLILGKKSKAVSESTPANVEEKTGNDCIASRTRQRKCVLTKSQISGPLELRDSPKVRACTYTCTYTITELI